MLGVTSLRRVSRELLQRRQQLTTAATQAPTTKSKLVDVRSALHPVVLFCTGAGTVYLTHSALEDVALYRHCVTVGCEAAAADAELQKLLVPPLVAGPWWNSSVNVTFGNNIVTCTFPLTGQQRGTEVRVGLVRHRLADEDWTGLSNLAYVYLGRNEWTPIFIDAVVPGQMGSSRPKRVSLLPPAAQPAAGGAQGGGEGAADKGRGRRRWFWGRRREAA